MKRKKYISGSDPLIEKIADNISAGDQSALRIALATYKRRRGRMKLTTAKKRVLKKYPDARPVQVLIGWTIWATTRKGYNRISDGYERVKYAWLNAESRL